MLTGRQDRAPFHQRSIMRSPRLPKGPKPARPAPARPRFNVSRIIDDAASKGWNQRQLGLRAGLASSTMSRFITGQNQTPKVAVRLAKALGQSLERYLVRGAEVTA